MTAFHSRTVTDSLRYGTADKNFEPHRWYIFGIVSTKSNEIQDKLKKGVSPGAKKILQ